MSRWQSPGARGDTCQVRVMFIYEENVWLYQAHWTKWCFIFLDWEFLNVFWFPDSWWSLWNIWNNWKYIWGMRCLTVAHAIPSLSRIWGMTISSSDPQFWLHLEPQLSSAAPRQSSHLCKWDLCWKTSRSGDMGESRDVMGDHPLATIYIHTSIYQPLCHLNRTNLIWVLNYHKKYFSQNVLFLEAVDLNQC